MKRIVICVFILLLLIALGIASYAYTNSAMERTDRALEEITVSFKGGDFERTKSLTDKLSEDWRKNYSSYLFIFDKEHVMELTMAISRINIMAKEENPDLTTECYTAAELIRLYRSKEKLSILNIL